MQDYIATKSRSARTRKRRKLLLYLGGICVALLIAGFFLLMRSSLFQIHGIHLPEVLSVSQQHIGENIETYLADQSDIKKWLFGERNIFMVRTQKLSDRIRNAFPSLKTVEVRKEFPAMNLSVFAADRQKTGLWCQETEKQETNCSWFDEKGIIFADGVHAEGNILYRVSDHTGQPIPLGTRIFPEPDLTHLFHMYDFLEKIGWNTRTLIRYNATLGDLQTPQVDGKPIIYFNITNDPLYAIESVQKIKNEASDYIDLRVHNRVYYK